MYKKIYTHGYFYIGMVSYIFFLLYHDILDIKK